MRANSNILNENKKHVWTEIEQRTFDNIKNIWRSNLELFIPAEGERFTLENDASYIGLGEVQKQRNLLNKVKKKKEV